jgi:hypothetical protein
VINLHNGHAGMKRMADPQKSIAVEQTGIAVGHQS